MYESKELPEKNALLVDKVNKEYQEAFKAWNEYQIDSQRFKNVSLVLQYLLYERFDLPTLDYLLDLDNTLKTVGENWPSEEIIYNLMDSRLEDMRLEQEEIESEAKEQSDKEPNKKGRDRGAR